MCLAAAMVEEHIAQHLSTLYFHHASVVHVGRHSVAALRTNDSWPLDIPIIKCFQALLG